MLEPSVIGEEVRRRSPVPVFGPPRADELQAPLWDWRRELARALLLASEGAWLMAWAIFLIRWSGNPAFGRPGVLVVGWLLLALLTLSGSHFVMRWERRVGPGRARLLLATLIALATLLWWSLVSGGLRLFLAEIGSILQLRPGVGFWTLGLGFLAWFLGLDWSQQLVGLKRARETVQRGLLMLALLALLAANSQLLPWLLPFIGGLWLAGLVAQGMTRLVVEDWTLSLVRTLPLTLRQGALVLAATGSTLGAALASLWVVAPSQRAAVSQWLQQQAEGPARALALLLLYTVIFLLTVIWNLFYWTVTELKRIFGLSFLPQLPEFRPLPEQSVDRFLEWLLNLVPPYLWFGLRLCLFIFFVLWMLFLLVTKLDRIRYTEGQYKYEMAEPEPEGRFRALLGRVPRPRFSMPALIPEPEDTVRRIYVRLIHLGMQRGMSWQPRLTPYEYERSLREALPGHAEEIRLITEQYVRVRYAGEVPGVQELQALQGAWEQLQRAMGG